MVDASSGGWKGRSDWKIAAAVLEGLLNRAEPRLGVFYDSKELALARAYLDWLGVKYDVYNGGLTDLLEILDYKANCTIVYDPGLPETVNLATTLAGIRGCLVASPQLLGELRAAGLQPGEIVDLRGRFASKLDVDAEILRLVARGEADTTAAAVLQPGIPELRDYIVKHRMAVANLSPFPGQPEANLLSGLLSRLEGWLLYGFFPGGGAGEYWGVRLSSRHGLALVVSDHLSAASLMEWYSPPGRSLRSSSQLRAGQAGAPAGRVAAIVVSDGDNLGFLTHKLVEPGWLWNTSLRGNVPVGWTVNPLAAYLAPQVIWFLNATAKPSDCFLSGVAGAAYYDPLQATPSLRSSVAKWLHARAAGYIPRAAYYWLPPGPDLESLSSIYQLFVESIPIVNAIEYGYPPPWRTPSGSWVVYAVHLNRTQLDGGLLRSLLNRSQPPVLVVSVDPWSIDYATIASLAEVLEKEGYTIVCPTQLPQFLEALAPRGMAEPLLNASEVCESGYVRVYDRLTGDLTAMVLAAPRLLLENGTGIWPSRLNGAECSVAMGNGSASIVIAGPGFTVNRTLQVVEGGVVIHTVIEAGNLSSVEDPVLDQLDTIIWPPRGPGYAAEARGPLLASTNTTTRLRPPGLDPFQICGTYPWVEIIGSRWTPPLAVEARVASAPGGWLWLDAYNPGGDSDGDGVAEYHALTLRVPAEEGGVEYIVVITARWLGG